MSIELRYSRGTYVVVTPDDTTGHATLEEAFEVAFVMAAAFGQSIRFTCPQAHSNVRVMERAFEKWLIEKQIAKEGDFR